jgi:hypothetical protein
MKSFRIFIPALLIALIVPPAEAARWIKYDGEVPENAVRIGPKQLPVCGGQTKQGFRLGWYDEGIEVCRVNVKAVGKDSGGLEEFRLMVQPGGNDGEPDPRKLRKMRQTAVKIHMSKLHGRLLELAKLNRVGGEECTSRFPEMGKSNTRIMESVRDARCKARSDAYRGAAKMIMSNYNPDGGPWIGEEEDENVRGDEDLQRIKELRLRKLEARERQSEEN